MTDITIDLNKSQGFVTSPPERNSDFMAAFISYGNLLAALGNENERNQEYMIIENPTDLLSRLSSTGTTGWYIFNGLDPDGTSTYINETPDKSNTNNRTGLNWPNGLINFDQTDPGISEDFYAVLNYLRYGGKCFVAGAPDNLPDTINNGVQTIENTPKVINCIYTTSPSYNNTITSIAQNRGDCMAICQVNVKAPISSTRPDGIPTIATNQNKLTFHVAGQKIHLGTSSNLVSENDTKANLITTGVAADVAGCMARVTSGSRPYTSPAGTGAGALLDVIRMEYDLTATDREALATDYINPIRTFEGYGSVLFGDRTGNQDVNQKIFNYVNVSSTYLQISRSISNIIREYMFRINNATNRSALTSAINSILRRMVAAGALTGFSVICDETNNPENIIAENRLICDARLQFPLSIQDVALRFQTSSGTQTTQGLSTTSGSSSSTSTSSPTTNRSSSSSGGSSY